jgi:hypothetical protein
LRVFSLRRSSYSSSSCAFSFSRYSASSLSRLLRIRSSFAIRCCVRRASSASRWRLILASSSSTRFRTLSSFRLRLAISLFRLVTNTSSTASNSTRRCLSAPRLSACRCGFVSGVEASMWSRRAEECCTVREELSMSDGDAETSLPESSSSKLVTPGTTDFASGSRRRPLSMP